MRALIATLAASTVLTACSSSPGTVTHTTAGQATASGSARPVAGSFDVVTENRRPGTTAWQIPRAEQADDHALAGFLDRDSVLPGTPVVLRVTTTAASFTARAYRLGWYGGTGGRLVWSSGTMPAIKQPAPRVEAGNMVDCSAWRPSATISTTGWPPGLYVLKLTDLRGKSKWVPLTVRSASTRGALVLVNATPTYEAYNQWGGYSLYKGPHGADRATRVSFNRPYDRSGARHIMAGERQVTELAEKLGLRTAYVTQLDIDKDPHLLDGARGAVSMAHDEYWSVAMRRAWESARDRGTNLAFMGANAVYWRIRIEGRTITCYKSAGADPVAGQADTTAMWRSAPQPRPENSLTGELYECFPARAALSVTDARLWLFKGTGAANGSRFNGLIGPEVDRAYPIAGTPNTLEVGAHTEVRCSTKGTTYSDLAYYTTSSGAGVFDSGSMDFTVGVLSTNKAAGIDAAASRFATRVVANLLAGMARGPLASSHPAVPNLRKLRASASTGTGTGGPLG